MNERTLYQHHNLRYYYEGRKWGWVVYAVDENGDQCEPAEYYPNRNILLLNFPEFQFKRCRDSMPYLPPGTYTQDKGRYLVRMKCGTYTRTAFLETAKELTK